jgi:hypothetical protein
MSNDHDPRNNEDSTIAIIVGMTISVLASGYILYISGAFGR